jgi:hypothetical protein
MPSEDRKKLSGILYIIKIYNESESFYKVGITRHDVKSRFSGHSRMPYSYEIISEFCGNMDQCFHLEKEIKMINTNAGYHYQPRIGFAGKGECFNNILIESFNLLKISLDF